MSSEITKKRSVSSEVIVETCSSEVKITSSEQIINANNHYSTESTEKHQDDLSLQDYIDAEINSRLSNITCEATSNTTIAIEESSEHYTCMSNNLTNKEPIEITAEVPSPEPTPNIEYEVTTNTKQDTHIFLENEKYFNSLQAPVQEDTPPIVKINEENSLLKNPEECKLERPPSIKDKLMLGNDEQMALLFSTTITSPAFTPTEENYDFLQAIKRDSSIDEFEQIENMLSQNSGEISPEDEREISQESDLSEAMNVKSTIKVQDSIQLIEDEIKDLDFVRIDSPEEVENGKGVNGDETDDCNQQYSLAKNQFIVNDKNVINSQESSPLTSTAPSFEKCDNTNPLILDLNSTTTNSIQTTMSETVEHTSNIIQDSNKTVKKKKSKKSKKDHEKENISVKSSFSKFDALSKKTIHVRSSDAGKAQTKFNGSTTLIEQQNCKSCSKQVFQMEQIKAENSIWHKNCFRCTECNKQLTVDTYESHEGTLYCKPHFKALFAPKVVEETQPTSDKPDLGLEELQSLNVKERFQVFEHANDKRFQVFEHANVKRSSSILSKLAKFQAKGMDVGVSDDALNGTPVEQRSDESKSDEDLGEDADLIRAQRKSAQKEQPIVFDKLNDLKSRWESGSQMTKDERREECKQEIQSIRSRLFMGKQGKMKEMYQQAVMDSESGANVKKLIPTTEISDTAKSIKERFEKGENNSNDNHKNMEEDMSIFEAGISKKSRDIFKELDATATKTTQMLPLQPVKSQSDIKRDNSPERDIYRDPDVVRAEETVEDPTIAEKTHTASKMLSIFRQLEEKNAHEQIPTGPKPLKCFTPPPEPARGESESEEDESSEEEDESEPEPASDVVRALDKPTDEFLVQAQNAARAKQLRAKFEKWEENEIRREQRETNQSSINLGEENSEEQIESAKSLRARFESMRETTTQSSESKPKVKVHRFVDMQVTNNAEICEGCTKRVYPLERIECNTKVYHKQCFRCLQCKTVLRMDSYTLNQGMLYCLTHFKQLFKAKGNYETGFGLDQHKSKWEQSNGHVTPAH